MASMHRRHPAAPELLEAARSGDTARVTALLRRGVPVDSTDVFGLTPLIGAAVGGHTATLEALLAAGAVISLKDNEGGSALSCAASHGRTAVVQSLVAAKADLNIQAKNKWTALHFAAAFGYSAVVEVLVAAGANVNIASNRGETPLMVAAGRGDTAMMKSFVAAGADVNIKDKCDETPLMAAARNSHTATVQSLVASKADVTNKDKYGRTALHHATLWGNAATVDVLVAAAADMSIADTWGQTPLMAAAGEGDTAAVQSLLSAGADMDIQDKEGLTALDVAKKYGHQSVVKKLEARKPMATSQPVAREPVVIPFKDLELEKTVGEGAFGAVFKGYWTSSDGGRQLVAVKQLSSVVEKEIKILGSIRHPNVITLYGTSVKKPFTYLVTDFAENGSLFGYISERLSSPDLKRALPWAKQVAEGMASLHSHGIVHRDLKSSNVVLTSEWVAKICDLGAARELDHTTMMTSVGTVAWMAPEMLKEEHASPKCDIYSYAIVLWELVSFQVPFKGLARFPIMMKVTSGERPAIPSGCDQSLSDLIKRCWADDFKERPSFDEILKTLKSVT